MAERLKFIEQKLLENEINSGKKVAQNISPSHQSANHFYQESIQQQTQPNYSYQNYLKNIPKNQDDHCLKNGQFHARIYPSISFGDCSEINIQQKNQKNKRNFFSSAKSAVKNSRSIPSCKLHFLNTLSNDSEKNEYIL